VGGVIGEVVPLAVAIALSPFPIIPAILLLFTPRPRANAAGFLVGWVLGILAATVVFAALATVVEGREQPPEWAAWVRIVVGVALVALGVRQWFGRQQRTEPPGWLRSIERSTPASAGRLGLLLSAANPKIVLLAAAAGVVIGSAELDPGAMVAVIATFTLIAAITVAMPLALFSVLGESMLTPLGRARGWLEANNASIMAVVMAVIGVLVAARGIGGL
jgi:threonine/homoserine/homoserine lactone efflux protein